MATHGDVALEIGKQVEQMILKAKQDSEVRVKRDLSVAKSQLQQMEGLIGDLTARVARCAQSNDPSTADTSQTVDLTFLNQKVGQLEQKWGSEVKALKQDLHRTILAHNHNSDLMRIHRDSLDDARKKLDAQAQPRPEVVDTQLAKLETILRQQQVKQRQIEALGEQMAHLEQQTEDILAGCGASLAPQFPGMMMPPGMPNLPSLAQATQMAGAAAPKRGPKKDEPVTEEEVRARFLQHTRAAQAAANGASSFNAEAPAFVPGGVATASVASKLGADGNTSANADDAGDSSGDDEDDDAADDDGDAPTSA